MVARVSHVVEHSKMAFLFRNVAGGNYLNSLTGPKAEPSESAPVGASAEGGDAPMTAAAATETAMSVVAQWEEEKTILPVGQDYVEELRGPDGRILTLDFAC